MRDNIAGEHCVLCGVDAAVRVSGTSFCAPCGLQQHRAGTPGYVPPVRRKRRAALIGLFSSGFLAKMLLGAVAVAAVGGVAATTVRDNVEPPPVTAVEEVVAAPVTSAPAAGQESPTTSSIPKEAGSVVATPSGSDQAQAAHEYAWRIQEWADCVSSHASEHSGGAFDPREFCPKPNPHDFGLVAASPPGHDGDGPGNSADAPGHDGDGPGNSANAPGQSGDGPGNSADAPGQSDDGPGNSENADKDNDKDKDKDKDKDDGED